MFYDNQLFSCIKHLVVRGINLLHLRAYCNSLPTVIFAFFTLDGSHGTT
jgi:hypothetical protein